MSKMINRDYVRGRLILTIAAPLQHEKTGINKQAKTIPLPVAERSHLLSKRFGKTMHIKDIFNYMRENKLFPESPSQRVKKQ